MTDISIIDARDSARCPLLLPHSLSADLMLLSYGIVSSALVLTVELLTLERGLRAEEGPILVSPTSHLIVRLVDPAI